jgi:hypothetical protein
MNMQETKGVFSVLNKHAALVDDLQAASMWIDDDDAGEYVGVLIDDINRVIYNLFSFVAMNEVPIPTPASVMNRYYKAVKREAIGGFWWEPGRNDEQYAAWLASGAVTPELVAKTAKDAMSLLAAKAKAHGETTA